MRAANTLLILVLIASILSIIFLAGCQKAQCSVNNDCRLASNKCDISRCVKARCVLEVGPNCCGNGECEASSGENKCSCPVDCGKCSGKVKYDVIGSRGPKQVNASYAIYYCEDSECKIGVDNSVVTQLSLMPTNNIDEAGAFTAETLTIMNNPFIIGNDKVTVRIRLTDLNPAVTSMGIIFTNIQIVSGSELMGERVIVKKMITVGQLLEETFSLNSSQSLVEEDKTIYIKVDYEYTLQGKAAPIRNSYKAKLADKVWFIVP
jgi:hypothetical protein